MLKENDYLPKTLFCNLTPANQDSHDLTQKKGEISSKTNTWPISYTEC